MVGKLDVDSDYFSSLPPEVQHDLLLEKKELEKHTYTPADCLPEVHVCTCHRIHVNISCTDNTDCMCSVIV